MKRLIMVAVITLTGFFAFNAQARPAALEVINFHLVYQPQGSNFSYTVTSSNVTTYVDGNLKGKAFRINSKDIIKLIGAAFETNFPSGSQLALAGGEFVIVDSTGTNVIFYPNSATPPNSSDWEFYFLTSGGITWAKDVSNSLGDDKDDYNMRSIIHIYLRNQPNTEDALAATTDLSANTFDLIIGGLMTRDYSSRYNHSNTALVQKLKTKLTGLAGEGSIGDQYGILTGSAKSHGFLRLDVGPAIVK